MHGQEGYTPTLISFGVIAGIVALRSWRGQKLRRLRLQTLWIMPVLFTGVAAMLYASLPPAGWGWALCLVAGAVGLALGWQRGRLMRIEVDPITHALNHRPSPAALFFIVGLVVVRALLKQAMAHGGATMLHLNAATVTDAFVALGWGVIVAQRAEMFLRARRLLRAARAV
ncbi:CcdC protein domain-containing protein [Sphingomonas silueang]|uniref:CcdC protein domain-containing protein n=1 Tax=Sphingomonas silueang TaxID=3156617 RepID=UPI0032B57CBF